MTFTSKFITLFLVVAISTLFTPGLLQAARTDGVIAPPPNTYPNVSGSIDFQGEALFGISQGDLGEPGQDVQESSDAQSTQDFNGNKKEFNYKTRLVILFVTVLLMFMLVWLAHKKKVL